MPENNQQHSSAPEVSENIHPSRVPFAGARHISDALKHYSAAIVVAGAVFTALSFYLLNRRGYYNLYIINKVFAGTGAVTLGLVLLIGPLSRLFTLYDRCVEYRKALGIVSFFVICAHVLSSYFFLEEKFPRGDFYTKGFYPFLFGLLATIVLAMIFAISNRRALEIFGGKKWWHFQNWGVRIIFLLVALHVFVMKYSGWVSWYQKGGSQELAHREWPGAGLLVGWFIAFVIAVRLGEMLGVKAGRVTVYLGTILLLGAYIGTFLWGRQFLF